MADQKLTQLTENTNPAGGDILYIVDDPAGTPTPQKVTVNNLLESTVQSVSDDGISTDVDNTDPQNPIVALSAGAQGGIALAYSALQEQTYQTFIYNSSGAQSGNRFNDFSDLMTAKDGQEGGCKIIIEQNETVPTGAWNFDYILSWEGNNGLEYNTGGWTVTFGDNTTISSWVGCNTPLKGLRFLSTSTTGSIFTTSAAVSWINDSVAHLHSTNYPFIKNTGGGLCVVGGVNSGRFAKLSGGVENFENTSGAGTCFLVYNRGAGAIVDNNTLKSTNAVVFLDIVQDAAADVTTWPSTQTNLVIGGTIHLMRPYAGAIRTDTSPGITSTTLKNALPKLQRVLNSQYTTVGNVGTGEDDLMTYTIPANTLLNVGDTVEVETNLTIANNANNKRLRFYFGGTAVFDTFTGLPPSLEISLNLRLLFIKTSSNNQLVSFKYISDAINGEFFTTTTKTDTSTIIIKATGETDAASDNDVIQRYMRTEYKPAP